VMSQFELCFEGVNKTVLEPLGFLKNPTTQDQ